MPDQSAAALLGDNGTSAASAVGGVASTNQSSLGSVWTAAFDKDTNAYVSNKGWKENGAFDKVWELKTEKKVDMRTAAMAQAVRRIERAMLLRGLYPR